MIKPEQHISPDGSTPLDADEIVGLKQRHVTTRGELNHLEQANIEGGLLWLSRNTNTDILNITFVREVHKQLFGDVWKWAGTFRSTEKNIGVDPRRIPEKLQQLLDNVQHWIENKAYKAEEIAVRFHHELVSIHPFPNGNGRHARIMANALLTKVLEKEPIDWAGGQDLQVNGGARSEYLAALKQADKGNFTPLLAFAKTPA
jgi:Fic-DOC domain mobile mystery protein B